jgi:hypothetical protein
MGRWNFDGFAKLEALVVSSIDRCKAMRPRLVNIETRVKQGGENEYATLSESLNFLSSYFRKESFKAIINHTIDSLDDVDLSSNDASSISQQEDEIMDQLDRELDSFVVRTHRTLIALF